MSFTINNKLDFLDSLPFLSFLLESLVKTLGKEDFTCLSQEFYDNVLDLVKQKTFYPYMSNFKKFKKQLPKKEKFYTSLTSKNISDKEYENIL